MGSRGESKSAGLAARVVSSLPSSSAFQTTAGKESQYWPPHDTMPSGADMPDYTEDHARAGINAKLPALDSWPNQFPGYVITTRFPEYSSVCPKTGLPDFGTITIQYLPKKDCIELKALKMYLLAYRSLGIFYENAVNRILRDIVEAVRPEWCVVRGEFTPRGGLTTSIFTRWPGGVTGNMARNTGAKGRREKDR